MDLTVEIWKTGRGFANIPAQLCSSFEPDIVCSLSAIPLQHRTVLFACLSSGWATITGRMLGPKMGNSI